MPKHHYYAEENPDPDEIHIDGVVILNDFDKFSDISGSRVIVFNNTKTATVTMEEIEKTSDLNLAFEAALRGDAEEISIERLVKFYLANNM